MDDRHALLCARIRDYCEARRWYGPDGGLEKDRAFRDGEGVLHVQAITHDARAGFEFPPATAEQLAVTESRLGYPLPSLLRALYTNVANGGFGPSEGITGAHGGYWYGVDDHFTTNDQPWSPSWPCRRLDLAAYVKQQGSSRQLTLPRETWPAQFLHLCYWGCGMDSYVDASTDRVYLVEDITDFTVRVLLDSEPFEGWLVPWPVG